MFLLQAQTSTTEQLNQVIEHYEQRNDNKTDDVWPMNREVDRNRKAKILEAIFGSTFLFR